MSTAVRESAERPVDVERTLVLMDDVRTDTERELVRAWAAEHHPGAPMVESTDVSLARLVCEDDDRLVVPVRVTWLPRERHGDRQVRATDLLQLTHPRRPWGPVQKRIARREPDRIHMSVGEPATAADLRRRFRQNARGGGDEALAAFVRHQAVIACDRAERQVIGDRYKVPRLVAEQITTSRRFRDEIDRLAEELERDPESVMADATEALAEVATVQSKLGIDAFRAVMGPLHQRAWTLDADLEPLDRLRELNKTHGLIFLPCHRAYVDPLVVADVLHDADFPRNHVLGGDNMGFWPIGPIGKRAGLIFIRRNFGSDKIYKLAVREVLGHLIEKRFNIEWYIEGGRTRTGKLRPPMYGLLSYLVRACEARGIDVMLVPTSIAYDRQTELEALTAEHSGATKSAEGLQWMAGYLRSQWHNVGKARVAFGEPFSLLEALEEAGEGPARLEKVAFRICDGINAITPVTPPSLVTLALLGSRGRALTQRQIMALSKPLLDQMETRGIPGPVREMRRSATIEEALEGLVEAGVASRYDGGLEPVWSIAPGAHHIAAFYRNGAIHHLVNRAIMELSLLKAAGCGADEDARSVFRAEALALRDLLKFEFFFAPKEEFLDDMARELTFLAPDWRDRVGTREAAAELLAESGALVAHRTLRSFLDAQVVVARLLAERNPRSAVEKDPFIKECLGVGTQMLLQGQIHGAESISKELFAAALKLAANRDLVDPGREEVQTRRQAWLAEVEDVVIRLRRIDELDEAMVEEVLDE